MSEKQEATKWFRLRQAVPLAKAVQEDSGSSAAGSLAHFQLSTRLSEHSVLTAQRPHSVYCFVFVFFNITKRAWHAHAGRQQNVKRTSAPHRSNLSEGIHNHPAPWLSLDTHAHTQHTHTLLLVTILFSYFKGHVCLHNLCAWHILPSRVSNICRQEMKNMQKCMKLYINKWMIYLIKELRPQVVILFLYHIMTCNCSENSHGAWGEIKELMFINSESNKSIASMFAEMKRCLKVNVMTSQWADRSKVQELNLVSGPRTASRDLSAWLAERELHHPSWRNPITCDYCSFISLLAHCDPGNTGLEVINLMALCLSVHD